HPPPTPFPYTTLFRSTAAQSILEGQATLAQILVLMPEQRIESLPNFWDLRTALGAQQQGMKVFGSAPLWLRESIIFPYLGGAERSEEHTSELQSRFDL